VTAFSDRRRRILFLGPEGEKSEEIRDHLLSSGCEVLAVSRVSAAMDALAGPRKADLLIADVGAGEDEIRQVVHHVRHTPETAKIPIIALVNGEKTDAVTEIFHLGCDGFLNKPVDMRALGEKVNQLLWSPQRATRRVGCHLPARLISGREVIPGEIVQICEDGAGLLLGEKRPAEGILTLRFTLPGGEEEISVGAAVIHVKEARGRYLHGVNFVTPGAKTRGEIRQYVQKTMT